MKLPIETVDPSAIPEVLEYQQALAGWEAFKQANPQLIEMLEAQVSDLEQKRQAADKAVRTLDVSCGPIIQYQRYVSVNGEKLLASKGREDAIKCGAILVEEVKVKVDMRRYELAKAQGLIEPEVAEDVEEIEVKYKAPKELRLP